MKAINFPEQNTTFTKPHNMTDEECGSLSTYRGEGVIISCWQPEPEDIEAIKAGKPVWLVVVGSGQPPVCLTTDHPFTPKAEPEEDMPHCVSRVKCNNCGYEWVAVWPDVADATELECNRCHEANSRLLNEEPEIRCRDCGYLSNIDEDDGMVLQCELSSQTIFLDALSFTYMSRCPLVLERGDGNGNG